MHHATSDHVRGQALWPQQTLATDLPPGAQLRAAGVREKSPHRLGNMPSPVAAAVPWEHRPWRRLWEV